MTFSEQTIKILDYICQKFGIVIDWTSETIWPAIETLAGKYIKWEIASSCLWILCFLVAVIVCGWVIKKSMKGMKESLCSEDVWIAAIIFAVIGCIGFAIGIAVQVFDIVRCVVFPEMELLNLLQSTLNSMAQR